MGKNYMHPKHTCYHTTAANLHNWMKKRGIEKSKTVTPVIA
jgi:hypothetical protein